MLRSIIFLKQSQISDYARMRLAALKIYGIPVRVFTEPISGFSASTFRETPNLLASHTPNLWIDHRHRIPLAWDEPMAGVGRPWFLCPACGRRSRHLYLRDPIACRRCHGLRYSSQNMGQQTAGVGRVVRLRRKLGGCDIRPFAPLPPRRRGRSRAYHEKLVAMIHAEEAKLIGHLGSVVHDLKRRIRVRKAKGKW